MVHQMERATIAQHHTANIITLDVTGKDVLGVAGN